MSRLRQLQIEYNALVPEAQARGLRGVRVVALYPQGLHERISHRQNRLNWLRRELGIQSVYASQVASGIQADFTFGVELEFYHNRHSRAAVVQALRQAGISVNVEAYNHTVSSAWKLTTDGSLANYRSGSELVSPVLSGDDGFTQLTKICDVLRSLGCKINKKCGMHVHVGARQEEVSFFKNLVTLYYQAEPTIDSFLAPSRRGPSAGNGFCNRVQMNAALMQSADTVEKVAEASYQQHGRINVRGPGRYRKLNLQSFWQHGTVEFRHHQGTVEAFKACNWVRFCLRMCLAARKGSVLTDNTVETLLATLDANEAETNYFLGRKTFFERAMQ